ncbi:chemotaxis protein MotB [Erythrobacter litoralis]|jgi:chemotaxis protein MotB|uniref:Flagellar motor protein n=1 Tax=Erythrobacter litoralis TaxID=39960 RepID=A0A074MZC0_9SPHN|nr:flagellar motor protein MotB [Erythrobacter litoralis]AOL22268.1 chemotaxis protein MotB [Erythrobacter litoralis]KEO90982.1 flagellar motor protein [Erythrobacter litoralis]MEE4337406.1 flagellar motor protein MotB [Erythrobacter sp.]
MALDDPARPGDSASHASPAPIIVKKITVEAAGHHGGAWKVAYADFVTAMMAFFLLLWLLGATEENQRRGIADYFTPTLVKMRKESAGSHGLLGGSSITDPDNYPNAMGQTGTRSITIPRGVTGGPVEGGGRGELEADKLKELRDKIDKKLAQRRQLAHLARQVRVMRAPEGIRIDLVDDADFSMFELGTTILTKEARGLLQIMAETLIDESAPLILRGHTDALPWRSGVEANNWSLSTGRAEATRQSLLLGGIPSTRIARIEGVAETEPLIVDDPTDPRNRRISLLLLETRKVAIRKRPMQSAQGAQ